MNDNSAIYIVGFIGAAATILAGILTAIIGSNRNKKHRDEKDDQIEALKAKIQGLKVETEALKKKFSEKQKEVEDRDREISEIRNVLQRQTLIDQRSQYVLLCGPRDVGKTCLAQRLHAPWDNAKIAPTAVVRQMEVPVINLEADDLVFHPAMKTIRVKKEINISLRIFDFPGEEALQKNILRVLTEDTTESPYGVVLIFMFDASEIDNISEATEKYYNGDLFKHLKDLQSSQIKIVRIILVFNKFDKLKEIYPNKSVKNLIRECSDKFNRVLRPIHGAVNSEKVCEIASILQEKNPTKENMGASMIKGEAARVIVKRIAPESVDSVIIESASTNSAKYFQQ